MKRLLIFGPGYTASHIAAAFQARGFAIETIDRAGFARDDAVRARIGRATHILSSVPPEDDQDPVLLRYGAAIAGSGAEWIGYLSSTGVYGDSAGAWVDESAPTGTGRRTARAEADSEWLAHGARVLRLPGIYGPGRSALERVREGKAHRIDLPGQVFSRIHVEDIASAALAALDAPGGAYNVADDEPCSQNAVIEHACSMLGLEPPPLLSLEETNLSPMARAFYAENRRVANGKAKRVLGWAPRYSSYREGLAACLASA